MISFENKNAVVFGTDAHASAAADLLRQNGAKVSVNPDASELAFADIDVGVVGPNITSAHAGFKILCDRKVPIVSELEVGFQGCRCLNIAVSGTCGKSTTAELIARVLQAGGRQTLVAGDGGVPVSQIVEKTRDLDFLTVIANAFQLERTQFFRPSVAVLLNIGHDHQDRFQTHADYVRAKAKLFQNQQPFDWAIVQSEAWAQMKTLGLPMPSKVITFSAQNQRADIFLDRGLLISRLEDWSGPLLDISQTRLRGPHFAEDLMAVLAVSRVLRLPLEETINVLKRFAPMPDRCELIDTIAGVRFINDARSNNLESLNGALWSVPMERGEPNLWLIAGGEQKSLDYHSLGPLMSKRVKGAILFGNSREKLRAAWSLFTPCTLADSLLEAVSQAAAKAVSGDIVLFSPACSSSDHFQSDQHRGDVYRNAVSALANTANGGKGVSEPEMLRVV